MSSRIQDKLDVGECNRLGDGGKWLGHPKIQKYLRTKHRNKYT
jgi:hypothetical protein